MRIRQWQRQGRTLDFTELGFGCAPLGNLYRAVSDEDAQATLEAAWNAGLRYFDVAPLYGLGLSETRLNRFLRTKRTEPYLLSTKVGRLLRVSAPEARDQQGYYFDTPSRQVVYDYTYDGVMRSVDASFERLGVDRIDVLYVHDLDVFTHGSPEVAEPLITTFLESGYKAMLSLREQGVVRAIGAGVNEWQICERLALAGDFDLFLLAGRYTLLEQEALNSFMPLCVERGIGVVIGGPYNSGILATGARPDAYYNYKKAPQGILDRVNAIETICRRHGVRLIEAALRFPMLHPAVVSVIPGGQSVDQVKSNCALLDAVIPDALWLDLKDAGLIHPDAPVAIS